MIKPQTCPVCKKPLPPQTGEPDDQFPFCSQRCRNVDLFRWSDGRYAIVENLSERQDLLEELLEQADELLDDPDSSADDEDVW